MGLWGKNKEKDWEIEVERILKEGRFDTRLQAFVERFEQEREIEPPEDWQEVFNAFFESLVDELPALACCIFAFKAGQVWQKYQDELLPS
jgi:hypothetical protein